MGVLSFFGLQREKRSTPTSAQTSYGLNSAGLAELLGISGERLSASPNNAMGISTFYGAVRVISETIASLPFSVYAPSKKGGYEYASSHPLHQVIHTRFAPAISSFIGIRTMIANYFVFGYSVSAIIRDEKGDSIGLMPFPSADVMVYKDPVFGDRYFTVTHEGDYKVFTEEDVIYLKALSLDAREGKSIRFYAERSLETHLQAAKFIRDYYKKGTFIGGLISAPLDPKDAEVAKEYKKRMVDALKGTDSGGYGLAVLGSGATYSNVTRTPVESQLDQFFSMSDAAILRYFGLPALMLGDTTKETSFGTGIEKMFKLTSNTTLMPLARQIEQEVDYKCLTSKDRRKGVYTKFNFKAFLRPDPAAEAEYITKMIQNGVVSQDEVRDDQERPPIANGAGSAHWIQQNNMTLDQGIAGKNLKQPATPNTPQGEPTTQEDGE